MGDGITLDLETNSEGNYIYYAGHQLSGIQNDKR
jgi:hypothetical protein